MKDNNLVEVKRDSKISYSNTSGIPLEVTQGVKILHSDFLLDVTANRCDGVVYTNTNDCEKKVRISFKIPKGDNIDICEYINNIQETTYMIINEHEKMNCSTFEFVEVDNHICIALYFYIPSGFTYRLESNYKFAKYEEI